MVSPISRVFGLQARCAWTTVRLRPLASASPTGRTPISSPHPHAMVFPRIVRQLIPSTEMWYVLLLARSSRLRILALTILSRRLSLPKNPAMAAPDVSPDGTVGSSRQLKWSMSRRGTPNRRVSLVWDTLGGLSRSTRSTRSTLSRPTRPTRSTRSTRSGRPRRPPIYLAPRPAISRVTADDLARSACLRARRALEVAHGAHPADHHGARGGG